VGALLSAGSVQFDALDPRVAVAAARATATGEARCGDVAVALPCRDGVLLAAIDGLGHGDAAATAAELAAAVLAAHPDESLAQLLERCHAALDGTRGAAVTIARIDVTAATLTWLAVGNVTGLVVPADGAARRAAALQLAGVVGAQLPPQLVPVALPLQPGDALLLSSDGVAGAVADGLRVRGELGPLADGLLHRHRRGDDDALVLLARFEPE
jgi:hypothetical protein